MNVRAVLCLAVLCLAVPAGGQGGPPPPPDKEASPEPVVERLDEHRVRVGKILVDQEKHELSVEGVVNPRSPLEYLATAQSGFKSYESALELQCSAVEFNLALILLGLDPEKGVPSKEKFDSDAPQGDAVEIWVEWEAGGETVRHRGEDLLYDIETKKTVAHGPWVYTGSVFLPDGRYLADVDGVLIGFMHTPESIVDNPLQLASAWGSVELHPDLGLEEGDPVKLVLRRLPEDG